MRHLSVVSWATGALLLAMSMVATARGSDVYRGVVVYVDDGDTVVLLADGNEQIKVRLASIDAPESSHTKKETGRVGQPFSENSKRFLSDMVKGKTVEAVCPDIDRYGRKVCELWLNGLSANAEMVRKGWAWANMSSNGRYLRNGAYLTLQREAQTARRGLWSTGRAVEPWVWRKQCWEAHVCEG